jgi:16S rRNA pseudouridine516 synthase
MRIDKLLSEMGVASRRECAAAAKAGQVLVDGVSVKDSARHVDPENQKIIFRGREITYAKYVYVMLNKPEGYVSATEDTRLPVVTALLSEELQKRELFPVGRLDRDTVGLMILTNNGPLAHSLLSPKHHVEKEYRFTSAAPMRPGVEALFKDGVTLKDGYECKSAKIILESDRMGGVITLTEGKYHQIKRMFGVFGLGVNALTRASIGGLKLDENLGLGECREMTKKEVLLAEEKNTCNI